MNLPLVHLFLLSLTTPALLQMGLSVTLEGLLKPELLGPLPKDFFGYVELHHPQEVATRTEILGEWAVRKSPLERKSWGVGCEVEFVVSVETLDVTVHCANIVRVRLEIDQTR